ncbi:MAG: NUDIX domain-containing protein [bacterium]|nr:NUDIX domain-containing protein [bacterium]
MKKKVEIKEKTRVFDDFFKIDEVFLSHERFDGTMSPVMRRLSFERGDSAAALVWNRESKTVILTNQFRYPTYEKNSGWLIEVVAGVVDRDEPPDQCIRREILEETGYDSKFIKHINTFFVSPGGTSERIILYYAEVTGSDKVSGGGGLESEHEDIQVLEYAWPELEELLEAGQIIDAKTIIALMWFQKEMEKKGR